MEATMKVLHRSTNPFRSSGHQIPTRQKKFQSEIRCFATALTIVIATGLFTAFNSFAAFTPSDPANTPMGTARGIHPGRVTWACDSRAATWNGSGFWWQGGTTNAAIVESMLSNSLEWLTGETADSLAWKAIFTYYNNRHGKGNLGYAKGERIAVKLNCNQNSDNTIKNDSTYGNNHYAAPQLVRALVRQLVNKAGVPDSLITLYDATRYIPKTIYDSCHAEFPRLHFVAWAASGGCEGYVRDTTFTIHWSQNLTLETGGGNPTYLPTCVTRAAYLINLGSLRAHNLAGVTFCAKNHFGSLCASRDGVPSLQAPKAAGVHPYCAVKDFSWGGEWNFTGRAMSTYNSIVDLMGHRHLGEKTVLFLLDGLYVAKDQNTALSTQFKFQNPPFNGGWPCSIFASQDGVALESVGLDFMRTESATFTDVNGNVDNYLHEASRADNPPSGTVYCPDSAGSRLTSLGVHEHWDNATDRKYSRNLGSAGTGIELVSGQPSSVSSTLALKASAPGLKIVQHASKTEIITDGAFSKASISIYNTSGSLVRHNSRNAGTGLSGRLIWDNRSDNGSLVAPGMYTVTAQIAGCQVSGMAMIVR
jgi:hypothetical protein